MGGDVVGLGQRQGIRNRASLQDFLPNATAKERCLYWDQFVGRAHSYVRRWLALGTGGSLA